MMPDLQMQHPPHSIVPAETMVDCAADVDDDDRKKAPTCPEMNIRIQDIEIFVSPTPIR